LVNETQIDCPSLHILEKRRKKTYIRNTNESKKKKDRKDTNESKKEEKDI
jgi:hypothetical protein